MAATAANAARAHDYAHGYAHDYAHDDAHLEELHDLGGREVVHADDVLRALGMLGDVADGKGGGVGGDDAVLGDDGLHLLDDLVLDAELLEDRLDHEIGAPKVASPRWDLVGEADDGGECRVVRVPKMGREGEGGWRVGRPRAQPSQRGRGSAGRRGTARRAGTRTASSAAS